jgi:sugar phosphate isomerase/epimerase
MMTRQIDLLAGYWTLAGDCYPMGPTEVSPFSLRERVEAAGWAGYKGMGLVHHDLVENKAQMGLPGIKRMLEDNGIIHVEVEFISDWFSTGEKKAASDRVKHDLLEAAAALGARDVKISPEMYADSADIPRLAAALAEVCEDAQAIGTSVAIEVMPFTNIRDLKVATEIVRQAGHDNGGLCLDIWHMVRGGISYEEVAQLPRKYIKSVELDDANAEVVGSLWDDTLHRRVLCGEGVFRPRDFINAIESTGFDSFYSVEILSEVHRKLPLREQAKRSFDSTIAQFSAEP